MAKALTPSPKARPAAKSEPKKKKAARKAPAARKAAVEEVEDLEARPSPELVEGPGRADEAEHDAEVPPARKGARRSGALVVVESPAKAKTIKKYLGRGFDVRASVGHVKDLPKSKIGVDVERGFLPAYETIKGKTKFLSDIKRAARTAERVFLATDPDREGEAIAWH